MRGGPGKGQGRKPTGLKRKQLQVSLPPTLYDKVKRHGKQSKLIQKLLSEYFNQASTQ